jgi:hypothetical protein
LHSTIFPSLTVTSRRVLDVVDDKGERRHLKPPETSTDTDRLALVGQILA